MDINAELDTLYKRIRELEKAKPKVNSWLSHVDSIRASQGITMKEAMKVASQTYNKKEKPVKKGLSIEDGRGKPVSFD